MINESIIEIAKSMIGSVECVEMLVSKGALVNVEDVDGVSPLLVSSNEVIFIEISVIGKGET